MCLTLVEGARAICQPGSLVLYQNPLSNSYIIETHIEKKSMKKSPKNSIIGPYRPLNTTNIDPVFQNGRVAAVDESMARIRLSSLTDPMRSSRQVQKKGAMEWSFVGVG